ncbi:long-chain-acyl-CoA synthetase [Pyruvatibacter mobilis]|uniref:long-chain-acyl-CoA synthetase n=1 Tax=Pyruvatibacter mobilis TaxID=1712261 RepID=UPI003D0C96B2
MLNRIGKEITYLRSAVRTLGRLKDIQKNPDRTWADIIEGLAATKPDNLAITGEDGSTLTYAQLNERANRYARWALASGARKGDAIALLMENKPEYIVAWLGIVKMGGVAALINTNLTGMGLAHCLNISGANHAIVDDSLADNFFGAADKFDRDIKPWIHGEPVQGAENLSDSLGLYSAEPLPADTRKDLQQTDNALYIYTSGTTGLPKAAKITHYRLQTMAGAFSAATAATEKDRMYVVLPLYHSAGGVCAVGAVLTVGGSVIVKRKFSAREFWEDCAKHEATLFQYIGELCRYLLNTDQKPGEDKHKVRLAVGNGLRPEIWGPFQERFKIPRIVEFYGATEGNIALMNYDGTVGAVGRVPGYAKKTFNVEIVKFDVDAEEPIRGADGLCIKCGPGEVGEALGKIDPESPTGKFDGYADAKATEKKILRDVFEKGDMWFRSGDLLKQDERGYFYFMDRIGDTFRWKGENVATSEVAEAISIYPGIKEANVYGVAINGMDGRAGMVSMVVAEEPDWTRFKAHLDDNLPAYAQPVFVRLQEEVEITGTFKHRKVELVKEGFDPEAISDPIFFFDPREKQFIRLTKDLYNDIQSGSLKL